MLLDGSLRDLDRMEARFDAGCVMYSLAEVARLRGDEADARDLLERCRSRFEELGVPGYLERMERLGAP